MPQLRNPAGRRLSHTTTATCEPQQVREINRNSFVYVCMYIYICVCVCVCVCVYYFNTFFTRSRPIIGGVYFVTHFSICHSFLDSYIKGEFGAKSQGRDWREKSVEQPGCTVAQSHSTPKPTAQVEVIPFVILAYGSSRGHLRGHMSRASPPTHKPRKLPRSPFRTMLQEN